jgi:hypothetical protein
MVSYVSFQWTAIQCWWLCVTSRTSHRRITSAEGGVSRGLFPRLESTRFPAVSSCSRGKWMVVCLFTRLLVLTAHLVLSGRKIVICSLLTFRRFEKTAKEVRKYYLVFEKKWKRAVPRRMRNHRLVCPYTLACNNHQPNSCLEAPRIEQRNVEGEAKRNKRSNLEPLSWRRPLLWNIRCRNWSLITLRPKARYTARKRTDICSVIWTNMIICGWNGGLLLSWIQMMATPCYADLIWTAMYQGDTQIEHYG